MRERQHVPPLFIISRLLVIPFIVAQAIVVVTALDNGLALTPPMGWLSWERFGCNTDCINYPDTCISSRLYLRQATQLVKGGYRDAGYVYVNIDDCWSMKERDSKGEIVEDHTRFPGGLRLLSQQIHSLNLKFGLYTDIGTKTCAGYPALQDHFEQDAYKFANEYEIDSLKVDGCYVDNIDSLNISYPAFASVLNSTGRKILYSCEWPLYSPNHGENDLQTIAKYCNLFRNYNDVSDSWSSINSIIDYWSRTSPDDPLVQAAGPGHWNDPDMLVIGNPGLSISEQQTQFCLWAIFAAPLYISADLYLMPEASRQILLNRDIIAVNQDPMGKQGWCAEGAESSQRVYVRELVPTNGNFLYQRNINGTGEASLSDSWAVVLANLEFIFGPTPITFDISKHLPYFSNKTDIKFTVRDLVEQKDLDETFVNVFTAFVDESSVKMIRITLLTDDKRNDYEQTDYS